MSGLPITLPNSLFSNMMMTICSKFGTRGFGVAVGVKVGTGVSVAVERTGAGVKVLEGTGAGVLVNETGRGAQPTDKTRRRRQKLKRYMKISIRSVAFGVL